MFAFQHRVLCVLFSISVPSCARPAIALYTAFPPLVLPPTFSILLSTLSTRPLSTYARVHHFSPLLRSPIPSSSHPLSLTKIHLLRRIPRKPQNEIHHHSAQQRDRQHRRPKSIVETALSAHADALRAPVERHERVAHCGDGDEGEEDGGDSRGRGVAEVEQAHGEAAEDYGEVEPGEEGAFVGEEDFGLDAGGEGDAFAW